MSLQGTFDTLSVTELFGLLSTAGKTGALRLEADGLEASVFVTGGLCCAVEADEPPDTVAARAVDSDGQLAARLVDVGFAFARLPEGSFRFSDSELAAYDTGVTTPLEPAVVEIRSLLQQWQEIEATIPSLDVRVRLAPVLHHDQIVVTAQEWSLLVALEPVPTVRELVARRREPMISVCRELKALVDRGAVEVGADLSRPEVPVDAEVPEVAVEPEVPESRRSETPHGASSVLEGSEPFAPVADELTGVAVGALAAEADAVAAGIVSRMTHSRPSTPDVFAAAVTDEPVRFSEPEVLDGGADAAQDRGALLRLFSALKES